MLKMSFGDQPCLGKSSFRKYVYDSGWFAGTASDDVEREYRELRRR